MKNYTLLLALCMALTSQVLFSQTLISEFEPNPLGTDPTDVSVELSGTPGAVFNGWVLTIESDGANGLIDRATEVSGVFDANGLLVVLVPDFENPSFTAVLTTDFTGTVGVTDIDTDDDGTADDTSTLGTVLDALGVPDEVADEATVYGADLGGADFAYTGDEPRLVFRDASVGAWYALNDPDNGQVFDISATDVTTTIFNTDPTLGTATFGIINPSTTAPPADLIGITALDAVSAEGDAGTTDFTFTITRSGDITNATSVDYLVSGAVDADDFGGTLPSGTVSFAADDGEEIITLAVSGDTDVEDNEVFDVVLSNPTNGESLGPISAQGTIQDDDAEVTLTLISAVQGSGAASPLVGSIVTVEGIVTGDFQDADGDATRELTGFYVQEESADTDGDATTSEGIFVFEGGATTNDVSVGDRVQVTGTVVEFFGETQLGTVTSVVINGTGTIDPVVVTLPFVNTVINSDGDAIADLEQYEGMLVEFTDALTVDDYFNYDRFGVIKLTSGDRPFQYTQVSSPDVAGFDLHLEDLAKRTVVLDDGLTIQNPDPLIYPSSPFGDANSFRGGDAVTNLVGNIRFSRGSGGFGDEAFRLMPTVAPIFTAQNPRTSISDVGGTLKVASMNVLNYFTTLDDGGLTAIGADPRGANSLDEFNRQTQKLVTAISEMDADVIGLVELENDFQAGSSGNAIENLVNELNAVLGAGTYAWLDPGAQFVGGDAIAVGFIYKPATVSLSGPVALLDTQAFLDPNNSGTDRNRVAVAQTFMEVATDEVFTAVINHFKSKGRSIGTLPATDDDSGDGQSFWSDTRTKAGQALVDWLITDPTGSGDSDYIILGDLNAYAEENAITTIEAAGYTDLAQSTPVTPYSFLFNGQLGTLDYALVNDSLSAQVTGAAIWHINSDEPDALDYNLDFGRNATLFNGTNSFRASDHDPVVVGLALASDTTINPPPPPPTLSITSFVLMDAETDEDVQVISEGAVINLDSLNLNMVTIRTENSDDVGSVRFKLTGVLRRGNIANEEPFTLFGSRNGDLRGKRLRSGSYELFAIPFSEINLGGDRGALTSVAFEIIGPVRQRSDGEGITIKLTPNPTLAETLVRFDQPIKQIDVYDLYGGLVMRNLSENGNFEGSYVLSLEGLTKGVYIVNLLDDQGNQHKVRLIKK